MWTDESISSSCKNCNPVSVSSLTLKEMKLALIFCQKQKILFYALRREKHLYIMFRLRYFTIVCNANECKIMDQDVSHSRSVVWCREWNKDIQKALVGPMYVLQQVLHFMYCYLNVFMQNVIMLNVIMLSVMQFRAILKVMVDWPIILYLWNEAQRPKTEPRNVFVYGI